MDGTDNTPYVTDELHEQTGYLLRRTDQRHTSLFQTAMPDDLLLRGCREQEGSLILTLDVLATSIGPLIAILLTDYYFMRRGMMDVNALYSGHTTLPYRHHTGINPVTMVISVAVGGMIVLLPAFDAIHHLFLFIGGGRAAILYGVLMRRSAPRPISIPTNSET
ncbi:cytosine permease [Komagataeibacter diospyri]|uniref:Uncharacterized protein n=1 Tax=Komagataeibacter diospyri TaxID=1932662 RepID=A0A4P5NLF2_9PROT|nr:cytosine permease [Komagataeibacter diospyri]GCE82550.1 hypothetical protein MSKU9_0691 [Komagataeibacter diospyri]